jgi:tRNA threonylcarbamoyl adenosine modification protein YeaZ
MKIVALEFSANERSVAVAEKQGDGSTRLLSSLRKSDFRGVTGLSLIDRALNEAKVEPSEITRITVGLGPGSYTGVRSAIAIAQGWQLGRNVELVGIKSVDCLAEQARSLGDYGLVTIVIDAQRQELYVARYRVEETGVTEVEGLRIAPTSEVRGTDLIIGPEATKHFPDARNLAPSAEILAHLAAQTINFTSGEQLEPIYLRESSFVKAPVPRRIE